MHFVVLSSSQGSNFQATLDAINRGTLTATCAGLVTDRKDRECIDKSKVANLPYRVVEKVEGESREQYDERLHETIIELFDECSTHYEPTATRIIACMGWMWILAPSFIKKWNGRILNVHPSLLPKFGGEGMYGHRVHEAVLKAREHESGMTIHLMDEGVDTGNILIQKSCPVEPTDTVQSLSARIGALEKEWYPKVLQMIEVGAISLS